MADFRDLHVILVLVGVIASPTLQIELSVTTISPENSTLIESSSSPLPTLPTTTLSPREKAINDLNFTNLNDDCFQRLKDVDSCLTEALLIGQEPTKIPKTIEDVDDYCNQIKDVMDCVNNYKKCLRPFPKTFYSMVMRDVKKTMKRVCSSKTEKEKIIHHLKCLTAYDVKDKLLFAQSVVMGWTHVLTKLAEPVITPGEIIPTLCCAFQYAYWDGIKIVNDHCENVTGPTTGKFVVEIIRSAISDVQEIGCGRQNSLPVCNKLMPQRMEWYRQLTEEGRKLPYTVSPIVPLIKISDKFDAREAREFGLE